MKIEFDVDDEKVSNFTCSAKSKLVNEAEKYIWEAIAESERLEASFREESVSSEITENHVFQATRKKYFPQKRKTTGGKILTISSMVVPFITGLVFDYEFMSENMFNFILIMALVIFTLIVTILNYLKGGE